LFVVVSSHPSFSPSILLSTAELQITILAKTSSPEEEEENQGWGLGRCSGIVSALGESNPGSIPGSGRDAFAGVNMPLEPYGVPAGLLCHVQQSTVVKLDNPLD
jgi:hypothetical protein